MNAETRAGRVSTLLGTCIVPSVLERCGVASAEGLDTLLRSETFALLSDPETGMWHLSPATIAEIFRREMECGQVDTPEEQS